ncbi:60S ribosomal protein L10a [Vulpes lagopus]
MCGWLEKITEVCTSSVHWAAFPGSGIHARTHAVNENPGSPCGSPHFRPRKATKRPGNSGKCSPGTFPPQDAKTTSRLLSGILGSVVQEVSVGRVASAPGTRGRGLHSSAKAFPVTATHGGMNSEVSCNTPYQEMWEVLNGNQHKHWKFLETAELRLSDKCFSGTIRLKSRPAANSPCVI